ncbi:MAG: hypothetical protein WBP83_02525, partial [Nitrososphaeraceae archaeon]
MDLQITQYALLEAISQQYFPFKSKIEHNRIISVIGEVKFLPGPKFRSRFYAYILAVLHQSN